MKKIEDELELEKFKSKELLDDSSKKKPVKKAKKKPKESKTLKPEMEPFAVNDDLEEAGITVAAFMLNSENASNALEFGSGGVNDQSVRNEILKAIQEEGDAF